MRTYINIDIRQKHDEVEDSGAHHGGVFERKLRLGEPSVFTTPPTTLAERVLLGRRDRGEMLWVLGDEHGRI